MIIKTYQIISIDDITQIIDRYIQIYSHIYKLCFDVNSNSHFKTMD